MSQDYVPTFAAAMIETFQKCHLCLEQEQMPGLAQLAKATWRRRSGDFIESNTDWEARWHMTRVLQVEIDLDAPPRMVAAWREAINELDFDIPVVDCPRCGRTYARGRPARGQLSRPPRSWLRRRARLTIEVHVDELTTVPVEKLTILSQREAGRREELLPSDPPRRIKNREGRLPISRTLSVTNTQTVTVTVGAEDTVTNHGGLELAYGIAKLSADVERETRRTYGFSATGELALEESLAVEVPAKTDMEVTIQWKRVWVDVVTVIGVRNNGLAVPLLEIPSAITAALTFDAENRRL